MQLLVIAGFLGSGKTTLLLAMAKKLSNNGQRRIAVIENEVGKVGIDGDYLKREGLYLREIFGGCVCCQLGVNLQAALLQLHEAYQPDIVIMEPSGVASPDVLIQSLQATASHLIEQTTTVTVIDAQRCQSLQLLSFPIVENGLRAADLIVINKIDLVEKTPLFKLTNAVRAISPQTPILSICATNPMQLETVFDAIEKLPTQLKATKSTVTKSTCNALDTAGLQVAANKKNEAAVYAIERQFDFLIPKTNTQIVELLSRLLVDLTFLLKSQGCDLIGHIKLHLRDSKNKSVFMQLTNFHQQPHVIGLLGEPISQLHLTINIIVYHITSESLNKLAEQLLEKFKQQLASEL